MMLLLMFFACAKNSYYDHADPQQFSMTTGQSVDLEVNVETSLSYRHRPDCYLVMNIRALNFGSQEAHFSLEGLLLTKTIVEKSEITIPVSLEGEYRTRWSQEYSTPCRDKNYKFELVATDAEDVLVEIATQFHAIMTEPGDLGAIYLSNPRTNIDTTLQSYHSVDEL